MPFLLMTHALRLWEFLFLLLTHDLFCYSHMPFNLQFISMTCIIGYSPKPRLTRDWAILTGKMLKPKSMLGVWKFLVTASKYKLTSAWSWRLNSVCSLYEALEYRLDRSRKLADQLAGSFPDYCKERECLISSMLHKSVVNLEYLRKGTLHRLWDFHCNCPRVWAISSLGHWLVPGVICWCKPEDRRSLL